MVALKSEIDRYQQEAYLRKGWHLGYIGGKHFVDIHFAWLKKNTQGNYYVYTYAVYFELEDDVILFKLTFL